MHTRCAYHQLALNGFESAVYLNRQDTNAFAHLRCNMRMGQTNYPEARIVQILQIAMDAANLGIYLLVFPIIIIGGGEYAFEADFLITAKHFIIDPFIHLLNFVATDIPVFAMAQVKRMVCGRDKKNELRSATLNCHHHYSRFTLIVIRAFVPGFPAL